MDKLDKIYLCDKHSMAYGIQEFLFLQKIYKRFFWFGTNFCIKNCVNLELPWQNDFKPFFVLNTVNVSEENEKLARTMRITLTYTVMKDTLKKVFSNNSSKEY